MGEQIPNSFEDIINEAKKVKEETVEQKFQKDRDNWSSKIRHMSAKLKKVFEIQDLMTELYTERQLAVEYHHNLISLISKINRQYRKEYIQKYEYYSVKSQIRFPNEKSKENKVFSEMEDIISKKESVSNHAKFMEGTIRTIDNIIFGVKYRIDIEQISRGK